MTFQVVFISVCVLWGLGELTISRIFRSGAATSAHDAGSLRLILVVAYSCTAAGVCIALVSRRGSLPEAAAQQWIGLGMIVAGIVIRVIAIRTLRRFFTFDVALLTDHHLIRKGLYRHVRHPAYTGALLSFYGLSVALANAWSALVIVVPVTAAFLYRIRVEESVLRSAFPHEYPEYERTTARLVPYLY
jgi:protein-S-isoprenylcysteine O-methyltransferase